MLALPEIGDMLPVRWTGYSVVEVGRGERAKTHLALGSDVTECGRSVRNGLWALDRPDGSTRISTVKCSQCLRAFRREQGLNQEVTHVD